MYTAHSCIHQFIHAFINSFIHSSILLYFCREIVDPRFQTSGAQEARPAQGQEEETVGQALGTVCVRVEETGKGGIELNFTLAA